MYSDIVIYKAINSDATGSSFLASCGFNVFPVHYQYKWVRFASRICYIIKLFSPFLMKLFFNFESNQLTNASTIIFFDSSI
jgi:hypothetical protein